VNVLGHLTFFRRNFVRDLSELAIHYPHSPLNAESTSPAWASDGIHPGDRVPDTRLREPGTNGEQRLLLLLRGPQHNLLLLPASPEAAVSQVWKDLRQRVEAAYPDLIRVHLILPGDSLPDDKGRFASLWLDPDGSVRQSLGAREPALALVRPDGYLGHRCQPASWEGLRGYLDRYLVPTEGQANRSS
jgi:hypothetical protein